MDLRVNELKGKYMTTDVRHASTTNQADISIGIKERLQPWESVHIIQTESLEINLLEKYKAQNIFNTGVTMSHFLVKYQIKIPSEYLGDIY